MEEVEEDTEVNDEEEAQLTKPTSVLAAVMPPVAAPEADADEGQEEDEAPPPVPKKAVVKMKVPVVAKKA